MVTIYLTKVSLGVHDEFLSVKNFMLFWKGEGDMSAHIMIYQNLMKDNFADKGTAKVQEIF